MGSLQKQAEELKSLREENSISKKFSQYFNFEFEGDNKTNSTYDDSTLFNFGIQMRLVLQLKNLKEITKQTLFFEVFSNL